MTVFLGFLSLALFIALIVGLVNPASVLRWTNKPTRPKVFGYWLIAWIAIGIMGSMMGEEDIPEEKTSNEASTNEPESVANDIVEEKQIINQIEVSEEINKATAELKERLEREINSINKGIDFSEYHSSKEMLKYEVVLFYVWSDLIKEGERSNDTDVRNLTKKLKDKVIDIQSKEFPKLRRSYVKFLRIFFKESNVNVKISISGTNDIYIDFIGEVFILEASAKTIQENIESTLIDLRFRQSKYKKYEGDEEYIYFNIDSPADSELVYLKK